MKKPKLKENMSKSLVCVYWDSTIKKAKELMARKRIRHLPVLDNDGLIIGIISDRDIVQVTNPWKASERDEILVSDCMSWPVVKVEEDTLLETVVEGMIKEKISAFLVTKNDEVKGIITSEDLLKVLAKILKNKKSGLETNIVGLAYQPIVREFTRGLSSAGI